MYDLVDLDAAIAAVARESEPKGRRQVIAELLAGKCDVGTNAEPNRDGIALLQRRALLCTALEQAKLWN